MEILIRPKIINHQKILFPLLPPQNNNNNNNICKKHPKHQQSPGVCSICLSHKLSHFLSKSKSKSKSKNNNNNIIINHKFFQDEDEDEDENSSGSSTTTSSSLSNYNSPSHCSSSSSSSSPDCFSPVYGRRRGPDGVTRYSSNFYDSNYNYNHHRRRGFLKSRSVAAASADAAPTSFSSVMSIKRDRLLFLSSDAGKEKKKKKKSSTAAGSGHFWSKLLSLRRPNGKRFEEAASGAGAGERRLVHSRTMRELFTTAAR